MSANAREAFNQRFQHYDGYRTEARQDDLFNVFLSGMQYATTREPTESDVEEAIEDRIYDAGMVSVGRDDDGGYLHIVEGLLGEVVRAAMDGFSAARNARKES